MKQFHGDGSKLFVFIKSLTLFTLLLVAFTSYCEGSLLLISTGNFHKDLSATQQEQISGRVVDSLGQPLAGVSVNVKGHAHLGTKTDERGLYVIDIGEVRDNGILVFSMVGFDTREVEIGSDTNIEVTLHVNSDALEEVVVTAFGTQKKREVVGAVTSINPSELKVPSSNLTTALAGRLAGVIAYQRSGEPGQDNAEFFVRGVTTFGYKKDPLILIDGVELTSNDLARLQPDDIESFSIMKDASATALYGARGANGVILVTTKGGVEGSTKFSFRVENSLSMPTEEIELADPITYMRLNNEAVQTRDLTGVTKSPYSDSKIDNTILGTNPYMFPATDWREELFKDYTLNQRANLNVSGGGRVARFYVAGSFAKDNGMLKVDNRNNFNNNIDLKTYLLRSNVDVSLTRSTELGVKLYGSFDEYNGPIDGGTGMYSKIMKSNPVMFPAYYPVMDGYEHVTHIMFGNAVKGDDDVGYINPYADMVKGYREYSSSLMMAQLEFKQDLSFLTEGLRFRIMGNTNRRTHFQVTRQYKPFYYLANGYDKVDNTFRLSPINETSGEEWLDYSLSNRRLSSSFYMESALNYNKVFNKHGVSSMLVYIMENNIDANANDLLQSLPFRNLGLSGRFTYSYDDRYFGEFNFGYNGSERFHRSQRFGFFPSAGIAWDVSKEKFWESFSGVIPFMKLKATYGFVGNDAIGSATDRFFYLSNVNMNDSGRGAVFGTNNGYSRNGVSISRYENPDITWETSEKTNIGVELGLFNKINIQADFFHEYRRNILMTRASIPQFLGLSSSVRANVGEASGKGLDFSVDYSHSINPDLWITARGNFTYATSAYEVYEEPEYDKEWWKSRVGYSLSQEWGYIAERLFVDNAEADNNPDQNFGQEVLGGDIKYRDVNGDGKITPLDQVPIGYPTMPEIVYGFGVSTGYKNFDLSAFFQGLSNESFWIDSKATEPFVGDKQLLKAYAEDHWSEDNSNVLALWPRLSEVSNSNNTQTSTWFMRNGAFLRLKTVEFGYTFPDHKLSRIGAEKLRLYFSGINLLSWSKFQLWDVEMGGNGLGYPIQKVFNIGAQISF